MAAKLLYKGEVWARAPDLLQVADLEVPEGVCALMLVELESETAYVREVCVNGCKVVTESVLHRGEQLRVCVSPGDSVRLVGYYVPHPSIANRKPDPWWKNGVINQFINTSR